MFFKRLKSDKIFKSFIACTKCDSKSNCQKFSTINNSEYIRHN